LVLGLFGLVWFGFICSVFLIFLFIY
jgi:hypothetical protein